MYKVIYAFNERYDNFHKYEIGDDYPRDGFEATPERIKELLDGTNRVGVIFIEAVHDAQEVYKEWNLKRLSKEKLQNLVREMGIEVESVDAENPTNKELVAAILSKQAE